MKHIILYTRVSTNKQSLSIEAQINKLKQYAKLKNYRDIIILSDNGYSGKNTARPAFQQMLELIKADKIEAVIVHSLNRFARSITDIIRMIELLNKYNVAFISLSENLDTNSATGRFFINTLANISQWEREQISERVKFVLHSKKSRNELIGQVPFGYSANKNDKLIKNISELNTLNLIKKYRNKNHYTYQRIADTLIELKRKNKNGNIFWNKGMICRLYQLYC